MLNSLLGPFGKAIGSLKFSNCSADQSNWRNLFWSVAMSNYDGCYEYLLVLQNLGRKSFS